MPSAKLAGTRAVRLLVLRDREGACNPNSKLFLCRKAISSPLSGQNRSYLRPEVSTGNADVFNA